MIRPLLLALTLSLAVFDWFAVFTQREYLNRLTKPAVLLFLIFWFIVSGGTKGAMLLFLAGLIFSLVGDVLLLLPERHFVHGLASFLVAHVCYTLGFNHPLPTLNMASILLFGAVTIAGYAMAVLIRSGLVSRGRLDLFPSVALYSAAIAGMLYSAVLTLFRENWLPVNALLAAFGGLLFFSSDFMLAYNRFCHAFPNARFWVRVTYHLGQIGLAAAALLHFHA